LDARELRDHFARREEQGALQERPEEELRHPLSHLGQQDAPFFVSEEIRSLDAQRKELRKETAGLGERIGELSWKNGDDGESLERLAVFGKNYEGLNLEEQKHLVQAVVGGISVDLWNPSAAVGCTGRSRLRTRRLLVNITPRAGGGWSRPLKTNIRSRPTKGGRSTPRGGQRPNAYFGQLLRRLQRRHLD
jgi:hypothetical protein